MTSRAAACTLFAIVSVLSASCHSSPELWREVASETDCTPSRLAAAGRYDSSNASALAGTYRLIQIDTARGWIAIEGSHGRSAHEDTLGLWRPDSLDRWSVSSDPNRLRIPAKRPLIGALRTRSTDGFTADNPQVMLSAGSPGYLTIRFTPRLVMDGPMWELPVERVGTWGFGGYFQEGSYTVPAGADGEPLGQRAGYYCAFRVEQQGQHPVP